MTVGLDLAVTTTSLLLSLLDLEQEMMTGSPHLNSFSGQSNKIIRWPRLRYHWAWSHISVTLHCRAKLSSEGGETGGSVYTNPLISTNCPDPAVLRLKDGSGYALVASSDHASRSTNSSVFPMYFSTGRPRPPTSDLSLSVKSPCCRPRQLEPGQPRLQSGHSAWLGGGPVLRPGAPPGGRQLRPLLHCWRQQGQTGLWRGRRLLRGSFRRVLGTVLRLRLIVSY